MVRPAAAVQKLEQYRPPLGARTGLRLDFNENTCGCSPRVLACLRQIAAEDVGRYPEREPVERTVADYLGLESSQVLLTNGVDEGIHLLSETYLVPGDEALIVVPTFSLYAIYAAATGARVVTVQAGPDFRFPTTRLLEALSPRTRLIAIANPNNPAGTVAERDDLLAVGEAAPDAAMLVDEAYFEFYGKSVVDAIGTTANLFVARTFSKAYGMAGLRAGVLAGPAGQIAFVRRVASPYNVNGPALACLPEALADRPYLTSHVESVLRGRARLQSELAALGVRFWPSQANFVLAHLGGKRTEFVRVMKDRGILVRDRHNDPGCAGCVRITVGVDAQTDRLIDALRATLEEIEWKAAERADEEMR